MIRRCAVLFYTFAMLFCGVASIVIPSIKRKFLVEFLHVVVAIGLGKNRCSSDAEVLAIALHDGLVRNKASLPIRERVTVGIFIEGFLVRVEAVAVYDEMLWAHLECIDGSVHGCDACAEDVHLVNLLWSDDAHSPRYGIALNLLAQTIALLRCELLGVVEHFVVIVGRQDDRRRIHAACKTASASFVTSCLHNVRLEKWR